jgi:hypothetical protein
VGMRRGSETGWKYACLGRRVMGEKEGRVALERRIEAFAAPRECGDGKLRIACQPSRDNARS